MKNEIKITIYLTNKKKFIVFADKKEVFDNLYELINAATEKHQEFIKFYCIIFPIKEFYMAQYEYSKK